MTDSSIRSIIIVGGGTSGWISAAVLARFADMRTTSITLVESEEIGIVGVGEATVPIIRNLNGLLGIDENAFVAATNGAFKLGIDFRDWGHVGNRFFHGFGDYGDQIEGIAPHHHWLKLRQLGDQTPIDDYSLPWAIARRGRFSPPPQGAAPGIAADYRYAYHFDAYRYARFLRTHCEARGVTRVEGKVEDVELHGESGNITGVTLADGRRLEADFFIDCSGFRGLLIEQALKTGYEDWSHWLPCDRAVVTTSSGDGAPPPCTVSTAHAAGWQWRIPLQVRDGNGYVYSSRFISDEDARATLLATVKGEALEDTRILRFVGGRRKQAWNRNCVSVGLASGFLEPLESTSIQLIQTAVHRLIEFFPDRNLDPALIAEYNRQTANEIERLRDFIILHYRPSQRPEAMWAHMRTMDLPDTAAHKLELWKAMGRVPLLSEESYLEPSFVAILAGNGVLPNRYDPVVDRIDTDTLKKGMEARRRAIAEAAERLPTQLAYIQRHCAMQEPA